LTPNGTGVVGIATTSPTNTLDVNGTARIRNGSFLASDSGNVVIGSLTDAGFRLDVNGSTRLNGLQTFQGTTDSDTAPLGSELTTTGTGTNWTGSDFATGYTHEVGSTEPLTSSLAAVNNTYYQITYTVTGRTAGTFTISFGGFVSGDISSTGAVGPRATSTATLVITPTSTFDGTIVLSIKTIGTSVATTSFTNSSGSVTNEIRVSSINSNTFIGLNAGSRNTTGSNNTANGRSALQNNTTGSSNTANGRNALVNNTTGSNNTANGVQALFNNTTGSSNTANGLQTLVNNTTGSTNTANGVQALFNNTTGSSNTANGVLALFNNTTGSNNTANGVQALQNNTTGSSNTANGFLALFNNTTGSNNTANGRSAGRFIADGTNLTIANSSVFLGVDTRANANNETNQIVIGHTAIGGGSNTTTIGNSSTVSTRLPAGSLWINTTSGTNTLDVNGTARIRTIDNETGNFVTTSATGVLQQRTALQSSIDLINTIVGKGNSGSTLNFNWNDGRTQAVSLNANCAFSFTNPVNGGVYYLLIRQNSAGGFTPTFPAFVWKGGTPVFPLNPLDRFTVKIIYEGTTYLAELVDYQAGSSGITQTTGTFTPTLGISSGTVIYTSSVENATYVKTGKIVHFSISLNDISSDSGTRVGQLRINGLPFTASSGSGKFWSFVVLTIVGSSYSKDALLDIRGVLAPSNDYIALNGIWSIWTGPTFTSGLIRISGSYETS
jgi:hypothetical protein